MVRRGSGCQTGGLFLLDAFPLSGRLPLFAFASVHDALLFLLAFAVRRDRCGAWDRRFRRPCDAGNRRFTDQLAKLLQVARGLGVVCLLAQSLVLLLLSAKSESRPVARLWLLLGRGLL